MATYRLIRKIAAGGMAEVFLAKVVGAEGFEKPVAVKRILPSLAQDREFVELFLREAKLTVCLQHANVVQVFDLGSINGQYYMVMEFVDGENLRGVQRGAASNQVPLGLREVCFIVQQVTEGLAYAHGRADAAGRPLNIIHRDVNPSNVMVASSGEVKLADFGIAKAANTQNGTQVGVVKGKAGYLAPEQVKGAEVDQRADLFLIGLMLYELLAGKQLFGGTDYFQTLRNIAQFDVKGLAPVPGVPPALWSIVTRALAPDPAARFHRARDISDALQNFLFDHRLRVGPQDVAALFARCFPGRHSPLEGSGEVRGEEIRLDSDAGQQRPPMLTSVRSRPPFPGGPRPGTPSSSSLRSVADSNRMQPPPPPPEARAGTSVTMQVPPPLPAGARPAAGGGASPVTAAVPPPVGGRPGAGGGTSLTLSVPTRVMRSVRRKLGEMLVAAGKLSETQLKGALERQKRTGGRIGELLVAEGFITEEDVVRALSEQGGVAFVSDKVLRTMPVPKALLALLPLEKAERLEAVPVAQQSKELVCAMREPCDLARLDELKFITGCSVRGVYATEGAIRRAIGRFYRGDDPDQMDDWSNMMPLAGSENQAGVTPYADKHTRTRERMLDESAFEEVAAVPAPPPAPPPPVPEPAPAMPATPAPASLARTMLVVSDDPELREAAVRLLTRQGVAASGSGAADVEKAVALGGTEVALVAADTVPDAPSVVSRLMNVAPSVEVRVLPSLAEALGGEAGPLSRAARLHARVVDAALAALGGVGVQGAALAKLARRVARRLGAGRAEAERASAVAYALALAAFQESNERFIRPSCESVRAILGRDAGELAGLIGACTRDAPPLSESANKAALALAAAVALLEVAGTATLVAAVAAQALVKLRAESKLPAAALEALSAEVMELVLGDSASHTVVLAEPNVARASALQARFLADGVRVVLAGSAAQARALLSQGSQALVVASRLPDGDGAALTRALRSTAETASLPIFVLAPPEDPGLVEAGLDAGADDVLTYPVNPDVLVAKLRRALQPRRTAVTPVVTVPLATATVSASA
ncbi:protein kinase [Vitiosangium sp. GDMCC 1.1324]|uniref:protein kinase domain-containing protein n=1 Tax=Vitiosangium sp. (strain GDMCC 1.1324) TaxID=2138576 RepID=UPI000D3D1507|nr:protein kinase [Vitiosangium sp. GDMCC 1.1324]PTL80052.1 protein kinase [Vitiosangium sp. GDMCC 1.1324]